GDRLVLFDNLDGKFGNATLDAALTGTNWKDRVLGVNRMAEAPLFMIWYATGNNVSIAADTARRVCHVRLESPGERPEERKYFRHHNLLAWVGDSRFRLLTAALTILRAYCAVGRPESPPDYVVDLRDALETFLGKLDSRLLGNKLRSYRRRIF